MILYHGTNIDFNVIDLDKSNKYKRFLFDRHTFAGRRTCGKKSLVYLADTPLFKNMNLTKTSCNPAICKC